MMPQMSGAMSMQQSSDGMMTQQSSDMMTQQMSGMMTQQMSGTVVMAQEQARNSSYPFVMAARSSKKVDVYLIAAECRFAHY